LPHPLAGQFSVTDSARRIRRYRYVEERVMRMLGGWIALTPELPAKLLMGRHVWDCAQHADAWGRRLPELRAPAQESEAPSEGVARLMDAIEDQDQPGQTPERLVSIYRVIKPQLLAAYERHLAEANAVYEPPTRRILERCIADERRHVATAIRIADHLLGSPDLRARAQACEARARAHLAEAGGITGDGEMLGPGDPAAPDGVGDVAADLLELERPVTQWPLPERLAAALGRYAAALRTGESPTPDSPTAVVGIAEGDRSLLAATDVGVVGCARLGRQWLVKLRVASAHGAVVLQTRWIEEPGGWQVAEVEILARERSSP
jgi:hypothetical protein